MSSKIVTFEELGKDGDNWGCFPCSLNDVDRKADVALLKTHEEGETDVQGLCCHHAEVWQPDSEGAR